MDAKIQDFFSNDSFCFEEKAAYLQYSYPIYTANKEQIGTIKEVVPSLLKVLSVFLNRAFFPFKLDIANNDEQTLVSVKRGWTLLKSKIEVLDSEGNAIAFITQGFKGLKSNFTIVDSHKNILALISGEAKAKKYAVLDAKNRQIGAITKDWAGILKEVFKKSDKYALIFNPDLPAATEKIAIVAMAVAIDLV